jgi:hypothetical protein
MTRQGLQQKRLREQGICQSCAKNPATRGVRCDPCGAKNSARGAAKLREKYGWQPWQPGSRGGSRKGTGFKPKPKTDSQLQ